MEKTPFTVKKLGIAALFKTSINPFIVVLRLAGSLLFGFFAAAGFGIAIEAFWKGEIKNGFLGMLFVFVFSTLFITIVKTFLAGLKTYTIRKDKIEVFNYFTFKATIFAASEIRGFSTSETNSKVGKTAQIILYFASGKKADLDQYSYFNFSGIQPALLAAGYPYFGFEHFVWKNLVSRKYAFDPKQK